MHRLSGSPLGFCNVAYYMYLPVNMLFRWWGFPVADLAWENSGYQVPSSWKRRGYVIFNPFWFWNKKAVFIHSWHAEGLPPILWMACTLTSLFFLITRHRSRNWDRFEPAELLIFDSTCPWLVVLNIFYFPIYWESHHPNWHPYFSEGWPNHQPVLYPQKPKDDHKIVKDASAPLSHDPENRPRKIEWEGGHRNMGLDPLCGPICIYIYVYTNLLFLFIQLCTSSTAQGGGGSFRIGNL